MAGLNQVLMITISPDELRTLIAEEVVKANAALVQQYTPEKPDRVLNKQEAARFLRIAPLTLEQYVRDGVVPAKRVGNRWRFSENALNNCYQKVNTHKYTNRHVD